CLSFSDQAESLSPPISCIAGFRLIGERDPHRRMIARLVASADIAIDVSPRQPRCQRRAQEKMVDGKARGALEGVAQVLPESLDALSRMHGADGIDPALR